MSVAGLLHVAVHYYERALKFPPAVTDEDKVRVEPCKHHVTVSGIEHWKANRKKKNTSSVFGP